MRKKHSTQADTVRALGAGRIDLDRVEATTSEEILRQAQDDGDLWTDEMMAKAHVVRPRKRDIHIRLDNDIVDFFEQAGRGYQSRINAVLRSWVDTHQRKAS
jgi:uncharacterized protein (DUF4415 family)